MVVSRKCQDALRAAFGLARSYGQGPVGPVGCLRGQGGRECPRRTDCAFLPMWQTVQQGVSAIQGGTTFPDLVDEDRCRKERYAPSYST